MFPSQTLSPNTSHLETPSTYDTSNIDPTSPRRLRRLSDIYKELDELDCHFSDLHPRNIGSLDKSDLDEVPTKIDWKEPTTLEKALQRSNSKNWITAMKNEMHSFIKNETWRLVEKPQNRPIITRKWVLQIKRYSHGNPIRFKARLVARDFTEVPGVDFTYTLSPTL